MKIVVMFIRDLPVTQDERIAGAAAGAADPAAHEIVESPLPPST
jgi:hypothetical protein